MTDPRLVLASGSPRRADLLAQAGILVDEIRPSDIDETPLPDESPTSLVRRLAVSKARSDPRPGELRLAADTIVVHRGKILGKPADADEAFRMLKDLAGSSHQVATGVALLETTGDQLVSTVVTTEVSVDQLSDEEIDEYVASGEPMDKAGAYGIQGRAALFITEIRGSYSNVVGLPLHATYRLFSRLGRTPNRLPTA